MFTRVRHAFARIFCQLLTIFELWIIIQIIYSMFFFLSTLCWFRVHELITCRSFILSLILPYIRKLSFTPMSYKGNYQKSYCFNWFFKWFKNLASYQSCEICKFYYIISNSVSIVYLQKKEKKLFSLFRTVIINLTFLSFTLEFCIFFHFQFEKIALYFLS